MTTDSADGTVTNKSLFKAESDVHGQLEKVYATDTKRKRFNDTDNASSSLC